MEMFDNVSPWELTKKLVKNKDIDQLIGLLKDDDYVMRRAAARGLGRIGGPRVIGPLSEALHDENEHVRIEAVRGLCRIGGPRVIGPLSEALHDEEGWVRGQAALALGQTGDPKVVKPLLTQALEEYEEYDDQAILGTAKALAMLGEPHHLESLLRGDYERMRYNAGESFIEAIGIDAVPFLVKALKDERKEVYRTAAWALSNPLSDYTGRLDQTEKARLREALIPAVQYLILILERAETSEGAQSFDEYINIAINVLGDIGDCSAIPVLENLLEKVKQKIGEEGVVRKYVDTGIAAGYISSEEDIGWIKRAIRMIKEREDRNKRATKGR